MNAHPASTASAHSQPLQSRDTRLMLSMVPDGVSLLAPKTSDLVRSLPTGSGHRELIPTGVATRATALEF